MWKERKRYINMCGEDLERQDIATQERVTQGITTKAKVIGDIVTVKIKTQDIVAGEIVNVKKTRRGRPR